MPSNILKVNTCKIKKCRQQSISVYGMNPFCRDHVYSLCSMSTQKNIFNEVRCNATVQMININNNSYCNSHYRKLIYHCNDKKCTTTRNTNILGYDFMWYCNKHKLDDKFVLSNLIFCLKQKLPVDIIKKIYINHINSNPYIV